MDGDDDRTERRDIQRIERSVFAYLTQCRLAFDRDWVRGEVQRQLDGEQPSSYLGLRVNVSLREQGVTPPA